MGTRRGSLQSLYSKTSSPRVFLVQLQRGQLHPYLERFSPREQDIAIEWEGRGIPDLASFAVLKHRKRRWEWDQLLYERELPGFLQEKGIEEVVLAGEMGPYEQSFEGCVGAMYSLLKDHFKVRGAKDCIFPLIPYRKRISPEFKREYARRMGRKDTKLFKEQERMFRDLYDDAVISP